MDTASRLPGTGRIEAFSDAVIAILMTIMVLDLRPPGSDLRHHTFAELVHYLTPKLTVYALSFVIIAKMWVSHHRLFCAAKHVTTPLLWLNNLLLFWMSLIPFAPFCRHHAGAATDCHARPSGRRKSLAKAQRPQRRTADRGDSRSGSDLSIPDP